MRSHIILSSIFLVSLLIIASTCRRSSESADNSAEVNALSQSVDSATAQREQAARPALDRSTSASSTGASTAATHTEGQTATLIAEDPEAQINVRSQPSSAAEPIGYGRVGEAVVLGRSEVAEDGYTWHYVNFQNDVTMGWIRDDLLNIAAPEPTVQPSATVTSTNQATSDVLKRSLDETCGSTRAVESYFVTANHTIYICKVRKQRTYLSQETGTEQVIQAQEVEVLGGGYIISNDNYEYRLDASSLVVVRLEDSGQQAEVLREQVIFSERY